MRNVRYRLLEEHRGRAGFRYPEREKNPHYGVYNEAASAWWYLSTDKERAMSFADIMGLKVYYEVHGDGDTIVLLHNGFACSKIWENIYPLFVEKGYKTVLYDRRGFGQSEKGADFKKFYLTQVHDPQ